MLGIGGTELLVILLVALLVLGPKKLPQLARSLGKAVGEFRRVSTEFQRNLNTEIALDEEREKSSQKAKDNSKDEQTYSTEARDEIKPDAMTGGGFTPAATEDKALDKEEIKSV